MNKDTNLIELYKNNKHDMISYLLKNNIVTDISNSDSEGDTLLHLIVKDNNIDLLNNILNWIKQDDYRKKFLNIQNNDGDTVLHIAVRNDNHKIAQLLESYGANRKIENYNGDVITATESDYTKTVNYTGGFDVFNSTVNYDDYDMDTVMPDRLSDIDSPDYNDLQLENIQSIDYTAQLGGRNSIMGVRYIDNNNGQLYEYDDENDMFGGAKKQRKVSKKKQLTEDIRKKVLEKIIKEQKVDELDALAIRAALWRKVKEQFSDKTNIEKHEKLEKMATKDNIKK